MQKEQQMQKAALVIGGTGVVGKLLIQQLLQDERYHTVWSLVRTATTLHHPKLKEVVSDFANISAYYPNEEIADVYCAIGTTIKKAKTQQAMYDVDVKIPLATVKVAKTQGLQHFVIVSAAGANAQSLIFYSRMKGELEQQLLSSNLPKLTIVRPPLIVDVRAESRFAEAISSKVVRNLQGIIPPSIRPKLGVYAMTIAKAMVNATAMDCRRVTIYEARDIEKIAKYA